MNMKINWRILTAKATLKTIRLPSMLVVLRWFRSVFVRYERCTGEGRSFVSGGRGGYVGGWVGGWGWGGVGSCSGEK